VLYYSHESRNLVIIPLARLLLVIPTQ